MVMDAPTQFDPRALPREAGSDPLPLGEGQPSRNDREFDVTSGLWDGEFRLGGRGMDSDMMAGWAKDRNRARLYKLMYWRKPDHADGTWGDICVSSNYPSDFMANIETGWTPLPQFGKFDYENPVTPWGSHWSVNRGQYRLFMQHPKAPQFISLRQVLELGWHRAPYPGDRRPDLTRVPAWKALFDQWKGEDVVCPTCARHVLSEFDLDRHIRVQHTERAETEALARTMLKAAENQTGPLADAMRGIAETMQATVASLGARQERSEQLILQYLAMQNQNRPPMDDPGIIMPVGSPVHVPETPEPPRPEAGAEVTSALDTAPKAATARPAVKRQPRRTRGKAK